MTFNEFIAELRATRVAEEWKFEDDRFDVAPRAPVTVVNEGGEVHTFTKVQNFGGGIVPVLNALSGNPIVAPECGELVGADFRPPGSSLTITAPASGTAKFQCCIHPWMRSTATVESE